jgi:hypothetical protein
MKENALKLSSSGMANITKSRTENDFTFIVGGRRHSCPWVIADFVSPKIGRLHSVYVPVNPMNVDAEDINNEFQSILSLGFASNIFFP